MPEVVRTRSIETEGFGGRGENATSPVAVGRITPRPTIFPREYEFLWRWSSASKAPLGDIRGERRQQSHRTRLARFRLLYLSKCECLLDENRPFSNVTPLEGQRLAGAKSCVGEHADQRRVANALLGPQCRSHLLHCCWRGRVDDARLPLRRLPDGLCRIRVDPAPLDGPLEVCPGEGRGSSEPSDRQLPQR